LFTSWCGPPPHKAPPTHAGPHSTGPHMFSFSLSLFPVFCGPRCLGRFAHFLCSFPTRKKAPYKTRAAFFVSPLWPCGQFSEYLLPFIPVTFSSLFQAKFFLFPLESNLYSPPSPFFRRLFWFQSALLFSRVMDSTDNCFALPLRRPKIVPLFTFSLLLCRPSGRRFFFPDVLAHLCYSSSVLPQCTTWTNICPDWAPTLVLACAQVCPPH